MLSPLRSISALLAFGLSIGGSAADVGLLLEQIELDEPKATRLVREHGSQADVTELRGLLSGLVEKGEAKIVSTLYLRTMASNRASVESIHEFIYPTEFDPPEIPVEVTGPIEAGVTLMTNANPTAFEMRPTGRGFEVELELDEDARAAEIQLAAEAVDFVELLKYGKGHAEAEQPLFFTMKTVSVVKVADGETALLAVNMPRAEGEGQVVPDRKRRVLSFLRVDFLDGAGEPEPEDE